MDPRIKRVIASLASVNPAALKAAGLTAGRVRSLILTLHLATQDEINNIATKLEDVVNEDLRARGSKEFLAFVRAVWPGFIEGAHIRQMAQVFQDVAEGRKRRVVVNVPPRHSKSELSSYLFPAWFIGKFPQKKIMIVTHTADLASSFGRRIRNLMMTAGYQAIFPGVALAEDSKAQGKWNTSAGGEFYAAGSGSNIAGRGADLLIADDITSEQDARDGEYNPMVWEKSWNWFLQGPRQRLQPLAAMMIVQTRWHLSDLTGKVLDNQSKGGEKWHVIRFPAILPSGNVLWPEFWSTQAMHDLRDELEPNQWAAQYMQDPTSDVSAVISRASWMPWEGELPDIEFTGTFVDTAHTVEKTSDWSAWITWGMFKHPDDDRSCVIMLEARKERLEYPDLKLEMMKHYQEMRPDIIQIEAKAAGSPLIQELRRMKLPVIGFTPTRAHGNKIRRLRQVSDFFRDGRVFYPDRTWAREVIEEIAAFPRGKFDDFVDCTSMGLSFFRAGNFMQLDTEEDEPDEEVVQTEAYY